MQIPSRSQRTQRQPRNPRSRLFVKTAACGSLILTPNGGRKGACNAVSGQFEVFFSSRPGGYRFRLLDSSGNLLATSGTFPTKRAAAAGIAIVREIAGTGLIRDMSREQERRSAPTQVSGQARGSDAERRSPPPGPPRPSRRQ